jgi:NDP-sugar pyrophosphorylase family protein
MSDLSSATAVVLAGGFGTRLRAVVQDRPKVLALVSGRPFLSYLLDQLVEAGVRKAVLCTGYMAEQVQSEYGDAFGTLELTYSAESEPLGTGGAVRLARPAIDSDPVLVLNGDSYCHADLAALWARNAERGGDGTLLLARVEDTARYGRVELGENDVLTGFQEKQGSTGSGWINAGVYVLGAKVIDDIPPAGARGAVSLEKDILTRWVERGRLYGYRAPGPFLDIGTPQSYAAAERFFAPDQPV